MPKLYIAEYASQAVDAGLATPPIPQTPALAQQVIDFAGTSLQSAAFNANTRFVRLHTDGVCHVLFGANPTATTSNARMDAGQTEYFGVVPGHRVAVIQGT